MSEAAKNSETYSKPKIIKYYADYSTELQAPERTILKILEPRLKSARMLDIGVGGGRTTGFFAPLVKSYTGIDFSDGMIEVCRKKFSSLFTAAEFETKDVRDLSSYPANSFDLILFSFNGLDNIAQNEREDVLKNIRRICPEGGCYCFSSHNLQCLPDFFKVRFRWHPIKFLHSIFHRKKLIAQNKKQIEQIPAADHLIIFDDIYDFGLFTYYVKPAYQIKQLQNAGFKNVRLFSLNSGMEIIEPSRFGTMKDSWIYYLCE